MAGMGMAIGPAKLKAVTELVNKLSSNLESNQLAPKERNDALEELKIYGRDPRNADPIFTKNGIVMLLQYAFKSTSNDAAHGALRVLANSLLLKPETRQLFIDGGFAANACEALSEDSWDDEFLNSRILLVSMYDTTIDLPDLIEEHHLAQGIADALGRHAALLSQKPKAKTEPMEDMALIETLKLMFNVTYFCPTHTSYFSSAVPHIITLLWRQDISTARPLDPPFGNLINALMNLGLDDETSKAAFFPADDPNNVSSRLIDLLDPAMKVYGDKELESVVSPLLNVIRKIHGAAPKAQKDHIRSLLLPTAEDREQVLGQGESLSARLLQNSTNPTAPAIREVAGHLLFDMSERHASTFVENVGYGYASGFLFQNNIPMPETASKSFETGDTSGTQKPVNPITGQFIDAEKEVNMPEMTEEEKEREAERLFVLFERLKKTGIIDVQNPVEQAFREGKFRELKDDEVEELD